jgi:VWFA-related protein
MLIGAGVCSAQEADGGVDERMAVFTDLVEVNVVNLFVNVTDRDGVPVRGLGPDDFEVLEDGKSVEITNFEAVEPALRQVFADEAPAPAAAPPAAAPEARPTVEQRRYLAILFDNPSLRRRDRRRVIDELRPFVDQLAQGGTEVMVATADRELELIQGFTTSTAELGEALNSVNDSRTDGDALMTRKRVLERDIYRARVVDPRTPGFGQIQAQRYLTQIEAFRAQELARVQTALDNLRELVRAIGGAGGRAAILWVGEDLPLQPAADVYQLLFSKFSGEASLDQPELWGTEIEVIGDARGVSEVAQGGSVAVHFLDAADPDSEEGAADLGASDGLSAIASEGGDSVYSMGPDLARRRSATEAESYIAGATGGGMLAGSRNVSPFLDRLAHMIEAYYSIGYTRPGEPDSELRSVEVRVRRPGVKVRTQSRVRSVVPEERLGDIALARLQLDAGSNALDLSLRLGEQRTADGRRGAVIRDVAISVPVESLVVVPAASGTVAQLMVAVRILNRDGVPSRPQVDRGAVEVPDGAARVEFSLPLLIPEGVSRVAVAVRDELSGEVGSASAPVPR